MSAAPETVWVIRCDVCFMSALEPQRTQADALAEARRRRWDEFLLDDGTIGHRCHICRVR